MLPTDMCQNVLSSFFNDNQNWQQPKYPSVREWVNKSWPIHSMESYAISF